MLLGAGELGKEVIIALQRLGVEVIAVDRYENAPGQQVAHRAHVISMTDGAALRALVEKEKPHLIVPEIEAIATDMLVQIEAEGLAEVIPTARAAKLTMARESTLKLAELHALDDQVHGNDDVGACIASGSHRALGMVIAPCSMKTLAEIATGNTASLMSRAAEVTLKERRRLVLLARETPLTLTQLRNMVALTEMGAIVAPPVPAFYARPASLAEMVDHTLGRVLDLFELDVGTAYRWAGMAAERRTADPD